jgi:hypothetical protein
MTRAALLLCALFGELTLEKTQTRLRQRAASEKISRVWSVSYEPRTPGVAGAVSFVAASWAAASFNAASFAALAAALREPRPESRLNCRIL